MIKKKITQIKCRPEDIYSNTDKREIRASEFALRLLMPIEHVKEQSLKILEEAGGELPEIIFIKRISEVFEVSKKCATVRLRGLGIIE